MNCLCNLIQDLTLQANQVPPHDVDPYWSRAMEEMVIYQTGPTGTDIHIHDVPKVIDILVRYCRMRNANANLCVVAEVSKRIQCANLRANLLRDYIKNPYFIKHLRYIISAYIRVKWHEMTFSQKKHFNDVLQSVKCANMFDHILHLGYDLLFHSQMQERQSADDDTTCVKELVRHSENTLAMDFGLDETYLYEQIVVACNKNAEKRGRMKYTKTFRK